MPGKRITDHQVNRYKQLRRQFNQEVSAAKAGLSVRSARRIERSASLPSQRGLRAWRTRADPLAEVWESEILPLLRGAPGLTAVTLLEEIQRRHPGRFGQGVLRTLQRRVRQWRALEGEPKEVFFAQAHEPGRLGLSDFTDAGQLHVRIAGQELSHRLYQFALAYSGWRYAEVILGGESWVALSSGLQNALWTLGGVPLEHRTDSLSAAFNNLTEREQLTQRYAALCEAYGMRATRNNAGASHENGAIEARQGSLKRLIEQALLLRGSREFDCLDDYRHMVAEVVLRANARLTKALSAERACLRPLPAQRSANYEELDARVTKFGLISVKKAIYSVPARLIGQRLKVRVFDERVEAYLGEHRVLEAARRRAAPGEQHAKVIDYRHLLPALKRKPAALVRWRLRDALFPRSEFADTWQRLIEGLPERRAAQVMIGLLDLAANHGCEAALALELARLSECGQLPDLQQLSAQFAPRAGVLPPVKVTLPALSSYDQLMGVA
jgi:hypothetical protein